MIREPLCKDTAKRKHVTVLNLPRLRSPCFCPNRFRTFRDISLFWQLWNFGNRNSHGQVRSWSLNQWVTVLRGTLMAIHLRALTMMGSGTALENTHSRMERHMKETTRRTKKQDTGPWIFLIKVCIKVGLQAIRFPSNCLWNNWLTSTYQSLGISSKATRMQRGETWSDIYMCLHVRTKLTQLWVQFHHFHKASGHYLQNAW